jgi:ADP-heptose:LPS heptosyltransferase
MRKVILKQTQSPGDILTFTRAVADLKQSFPDWEIDVRSPCPAIWENNPNLTPLDEDDKGVEVFTIGYPEINECGWRQEHWTDAFRHEVEKQLGVSIKKTSITPQLWISEEERSWYNQVHCEFNWDGPYWIINAGSKQDNELKQYHRWQEVADLFNKHFKGKVKLVQIGSDAHNHKPLNGVLDLVGKTDTRQLIRLCHCSSGVIGPLSFQFVIGAALSLPNVVLAAGKEDVRWHLYPSAQYIYANGCLNCCSWGGCWLGGGLGKCKDLVNGVPRCFSIITPQHIFDRVKMYYDGGILKIN